MEFLLTDYCNYIDNHIHSHEYNGNGNHNPNETKRISSNMKKNFQKMNRILFITSEFIIVVISIEFTDGIGWKYRRTDKKMFSIIFTYNQISDVILTVVYGNCWNVLKEVVVGTGSLAVVGSGVVVVYLVVLWKKCTIDFQCKICTNPSFDEISPQL